MKNTAITALILISTLLKVSGQEKALSNENLFNNATDSLSYCFGVLIGNNMLIQGVKEINHDLYMHGFQDGFLTSLPKISLEEANIYVEEYFNNQIAEEANMNLEKSNAFLAENSAKEGVVTLPSGLQYKVLVDGEGKKPGPMDEVRVHYHGTHIDGRVFDSSVNRGEPIVFGVNEVISGWTEALQLMQPGAKWMLFIPPSLAYGEQGAGGVIGPNEALVFEVELLEIVK